MKVAIRCQVVGSFADLAVDDGDEVTKGDVIGQIESMKVFFPIYAPESGTLNLVREVGEIIGEGEIIAWIVKD